MNKEKVKIKRETKVPIRISRETKKALDEIKEHPRETYDDIVQRLIERFRD